MGGPSKWSRWLKNRSRKRARVVWAMVERRPRGEVASRFNATIVVGTISCRIARNGKKLKRSFVPPREKISPAPFVHMEGSPGWNPGPLESRGGGGERTSPQDLDSRGEHIVVEEMRETGELQVKILQENTMLPVCGSAGAARYDVCATGNCVIPSQGKGIVETGLAVTLPLGTYVCIAPRSGLAICNFIDVGVGVVDLDYQGKIKVVLFHHSAEDFKVQAGDWIAHLILERIETP